MIFDVKCIQDKHQKQLKTNQFQTSLENVASVDAQTRISLNTVVP